MAGESSFDVVSDFDRQELVNAVDQAQREVSTRFDLKDTGSTIDLQKDQIVLSSASEMTLQAVRDVLQTKAIRRSLSLKVFDYQQEEPAAKGTVRQVVKLKRGIDQDLARKLSKEVREKFPKVRPQIQGEELRVFAKSRDELQNVIQYLKSQDYPVALQFTNYR